MYGMPGVHSVRRPDSIAVGLTGISILGLVVIGHPSLPGNWRIELLFLFAAPAGIATAVYATQYRSVGRIESCVLYGWGLIATVVAGFLGFLGTMGTTTIVDGALGTILWNLLSFGAAVVGLGLPYAVAGRYREANPRIARVVVGFAAVLVVFGIVLVTSAFTTPPEFS